MLYYSFSETESIQEPSFDGHFADNAVLGKTNNSNDEAFPENFNEKSDRNRTNSQPSGQSSERNRTNSLPSGQSSDRNRTNSPPSGQMIRSTDTETNSIFHTGKN